MELGSYFLFLQEQIKDVIILILVLDDIELWFEGILVEVHHDKCQQVCWDLLKQCFDKLTISENWALSIVARSSNVVPLGK